MNEPFQWRRFRPVAVIVIFFGCFLVVGLLIYRDFGTYWDEQAQIEIGRRTYEFLQTGNTSLVDYRDWEHGAVFEVFTVLTYRFLSPKFSEQAILYLRHLDVFLVFWAATVVFFLLGRKVFRSWKIGLLGSAFLFLSPVIFGNAFYNSKDIPFLSFFIFGLYSLILFLETPNLFSAALHALICALLINIRIPGVILPALTIGLLVLELILPDRRQFHPRPGQTLLAGTLYLVFFAGLAILFFPAAWLNPWQHFLNAYLEMQTRIWPAYNLFMGMQVTAENIPWYYIPVWIAISTPLYYVTLFLVGVLVVGIRLLARPLAGYSLEKRYALIFLGALVLPIAVVIIGKSVIYNGWRHVYFIYAPFLIIALYGFRELYSFIKARLRPHLAAGVLALVTLMSFGTTVWQMIQTHPYEFIYFNALAGRDMQEIKQRYELDYWGLSYVAGIRYLLANSPDPVINIASNHEHLNWYLPMLTIQDQNRLLILPNLEHAHYYITDYYLHPQDYNYQKEVYTVWVGNAKILSVFDVEAP